MNKNKDKDRLLRLLAEIEDGCCITAINPDYLKIDTMTYTREVHHYIYNDTTGDKVTIGPDSDGLDMIELINHSNEKDSNAKIRVVLPKEVWKLIQDALDELL